MLQKLFSQKTMSLFLVFLLLFNYTDTFKKVQFVSAATVTGEYVTWKQSDPRWANIYLSESRENMAQIGCAVTSLAILVVHSGCRTEANFNPGILCNFLNANKGFDSYGNLFWAKANEMVPDFKFVKSAMLIGTTPAEKTDEIKSYLDNGYHLILGVNDGTHWVAVDKVKDSTVYMIDPARTNTNVLFQKYNTSGVSRIRIYKGLKNAPNHTNTPTTTITTTTTSKSTTITTSNTTYITTTTPATSNANNATTTTPATSRTTSATIPPSTSIITTSVKSKYPGKYITTSPLNFRSGTGINFSILSSIPIYTLVTIDETNGAWGKLTYKNITGWICLDYAIQSISEKDIINLYNITSDLNYRSGPNTTYSSYGIIAPNTIVDIYEINGNWGKTIYNDKICWICIDYAKKIEINSPNIVNNQGSTILETATTPITTISTEKTTAPTQISTTTVTTTAPPQTTTIPTSETTTKNETSSTPNTFITTKMTSTSSQTTTSETTTLEEVYTIGDINNDGIINILDLKQLRSHLNGTKLLTKIPLKSADINADDKITSLDFLCLKILIMNK
jgi:uncharacterized protein YraI